MRTLKKKIILMRGDDVKTFQSLITAAGFSCGPVDGVFGKLCDAACKAFQRSKGLTEDGICGDKTWAALLSKVKEPKSEHFKLSEFACHNGAVVPSGYYANVQNLMNLLEEMRVACGNQPIHIQSGYRTIEYNKSCGGATKSQHLTASAADIKVEGKTPSEVYAIADKLVDARGGVGKYTGFTHIDVRGNKARW